MEPSLRISYTLLRVTQTLSLYINTNESIKRYIDRCRKEFVSCTQIEVDEPSNVPGPDLHRVWVMESTPSSSYHHRGSKPSTNKTTLPTQSDDKFKLNSTRFLTKPIWWCDRLIICQNQFCNNQSKCWWTCIGRSVLDLQFRFMLDHPASIKVGGSY